MTYPIPICLVNVYLLFRIVGPMKSSMLPLPHVPCCVGLIAQWLPPTSTLHYLSNVHFLEGLILIPWEKISAK